MVAEAHIGSKPRPSSVRGRKRTDMTSEQQDIIRLSSEGLTAQQIADKLGIPVWEVLRFGLADDETDKEAIYA